MNEFRKCIETPSASWPDAVLGWRHVGGRLCIGERAGKNWGEMNQRTVKTNPCCNHVTQHITMWHSRCPHVTQHNYVTLKNACTVAQEVGKYIFREGLNGKKTFSFGHCPNHLNPPPPDPNSGNLVLFFGSQNSRFESQFRTKTTIYTIQYTVYMQPKKQLKVQYIGIFEEIDSFYWPKMHF